MKKGLHARENKWGWTALKHDVYHDAQNSPVVKKAIKILQMVNKPRNLGILPIDGGDEHIYSEKIPTNIYSLLGYEDKYIKVRPPPTYIDFYELDDGAKKSIHHPLNNLKIREDLNRLECVDDKINEENKSLKSYLVKQAAKNFFKGSLSVSLPAYAFYPASNVSAFMNNFRTAPHFLGRAAHVFNKTQPEERIKLITAMGVSSLHQNISFKRAFNPILGETYEGFFCVETDNITEAPQGVDRYSVNQYRLIKKATMRVTSQPSNLKNKFINIFVEQVSHHPPVSNFLIEHMDRDFKVYGNFEEDFKRNGSNLEFRVIGSTTVEFHDGDKYSIKWPAKFLENNVYMKYEELIHVQRHKSNLSSVVFLGKEVEDESFPISGAVYTRKEGFEFNPKATGVDDIDEVNEIVCDIEGSWLDSGIIDDKKYWNIKNKITSPHLPVSNPLPSDGRYREDLIWLWKGTNIDFSQNWKNALEELQRKDVKLRQNYNP